MEFVIVLACGTVLLLAAVPNLARLRQEWNLWAAAHMLESSLQWGRMYAVSSNSSVAFEVDGDGQHYFCSDPNSGNTFEASVRYVTGGVRITSYPRKPLRFYQKGNAAPAGTYILQGEAGQYRVVVNAGGRIRIQRN